mmetsp:Transcript_84751/g.245013  ORF Transcript_84751/g.245013 Transcript_84751/m.245013 type:complete len:119 (-) Transcript_84751:805-1161(-)
MVRQESSQGLAPARSPIRGWERAFLDARAARRFARKDSSVSRRRSFDRATSITSAAGSAAPAMERSLVMSPTPEDLPAARTGSEDTMSNVGSWKPRSEGELSGLSDGAPRYPGSRQCV